MLNKESMITKVFVKEIQRGNLLLTDVPDILNLRQEVEEKLEAVGEPSSAAPGHLDSRDL